MRMFSEDNQSATDKDIHPVNLDNLLAQACLWSTDTEEYRREDDCENAQGNVEEEQPSPGPLLGKSSTDGWPDSTDRQKYTGIR